MFLLQNSLLLSWAHFFKEDADFQHLLFYAGSYAEPNGAISDIRAVFGQHQRPLPTIIRVISSPYADSYFASTHLSVLTSRSAYWNMSTGALISTRSSPFSEGNDIYRYLRK